MKSAMRVVLLLAVLVLALGMLSSCSKQNPLVGNWVCEKVRNGYPDQMTLNANGTGILDGVSVNWSVDGNTFSFTWIFGSHSYDYRVNGTTLYLDDYKYTKK